MKKTVLILEDQKIASEALEKILKEISDDITIIALDNVREAYAEAMQTTIDVFLIDIILDVKRPGDVSGAVYTQKIRKIEKYAFTPIIFITSLQDLKSYLYDNVQCYGYIEKPFDVEMVKCKIEAALRFETRHDEEETLFFRKDGIFFACKTNEIKYVEIYQHTMFVHGKDKNLEIPYMTCDKFLEMVDSEYFIRCSRNTIINKRYIENLDFTNRLIKLDSCDELIPMGITYVKKLERELLS